jgi:phosphopantothenoylcysteine synthetase/decarboxylase
MSESRTHQPLLEQEIVLGVTGGVAAYKSADLCSKLVQLGAGVSVVMTKSAHRFIGATTFEALTSRPVHTQPFEPLEHFQGEHIGLPRRAGLIVIAPATAHTIARIAHGMADDLLSTLVLASTVPILFAPAMNCDMWAKTSVQRNVRQLVSDGLLMIEPDVGWLSCGQTGPGRMAEVPTIISRICDCLNASRS